MYIIYRLSVNPGFLQFLELLLSTSQFDLSLSMKNYQLMINEIQLRSAEGVQVVKEEL